MARITTVKKARKDQGECGSCRTEIKAGDEYKWAKLRYGSKMVRCPSCSFRRSDLTASDRLIRVYSVVELIEDAIESWDRETGDDLSSALRDASEQVREVGEEYQESADAIRDSFPYSPTVDECEEKREKLDSFADELDSAADDIEAEYGGIHAGEATEGLSRQQRVDRDEEMEAWREEQVGKAEEAASNCPL